MDSNQPQHTTRSSRRNFRRNSLGTAASLEAVAPSITEPNRMQQSTKPAQSVPQRPHILPPLPDPHPPLTFPEEAATTIPLPAERPVTVPVLSAQVVSSETESTRDDIAHEWSGGVIRDEYAPDDLDDGDTLDDDLDLEPNLDIGDSITRPLFHRDDAFAFRERNWGGWRSLRKTILVLLALTLLLLVGIVGATTAISLARQATQGVTITLPRPTVSNYSNGVVVNPGSESSSPTPAVSNYQIGAWLSNNAPSGGTVKVFVRLSHDIAPLVGIPVTLSVQLPGGTEQTYGPTNTDEYGLATFPVVYGGVAYSPVFVTASAEIDSQTTITADTVFVPI